MAQTEDLSETTAGITELQRRLAETRVALDRDVEGLAWETDVAARLKGSFQKHQGGWIAGAATAGLLFAILPRRRAPAKPGRNAGARDKSSRPASRREVEGATAAGQTGAIAGVAAFALTLLKLLFPVIRPALTELAADAYTRYRNRGTPPPP